MKIALLRRQVSGPGGAEATLKHLARGLAAAGHQVAVYGAGANPAGAKSLGAGVSYVPVPVWGGKTGRLLTYAANTRRLLLTAPVEVVLSLERTFFQQVYRAGDGCHREWLARRTPGLSPIKRLGQTLSPFHRVMLWLEQRLFASPDLKRVIANSRQVKEEIVRHFKLDPGKIRVVYNGLDHQVFRPAGSAERQELRRWLEAPEEGGVVLFVGSGFARKGLAYLLEAFGRLTDVRAHLWVVGKGRVARYQALAQKLGVAGRVRFWGPVHQAAAFYQAADVLALPTLYDPCSNVVLEALGCGCPVITTAANGATEFITAGENGGVIPQPDDPRLEGALRAWLARSRDPSVSRAALEAVSHLNWEATVSQTLEVLEEARQRVNGLILGRRARDLRSLPFSLKYNPSQILIAMQALYFDGNLELKDLPRPDSSPGEALVRVSLAGICRTDLEVLRGYHDFHGIPGHEFVGEVVGPQHSPHLGQRVVGEINIPCGTCPRCRRGLARHCQERRVLGLLGHDGAFAEYLTLPEENLHPVPAGLADEAAVFTEPLAAALAVSEAAPANLDQRVLVIGDGTLGLLVSFTFAWRGLDTHLAGHYPEHLRLAEPHGVKAWLEKELPPGEFDLVVEASGSPGGLALALARVRPRGTVVMKSTFAGVAPLDPALLVVPEVRLVGSRCGPFPAALHLLNQGWLDPRPLISRVFPLSQGVAALDFARQKGVLKVLLAP